METQRVSQKTHFLEKFKSYYVVWKHMGKNEFTRYLNSLNRTM